MGRARIPKGPGAKARAQAAIDQVRKERGDTEPLLSTMFKCPTCGFVTMYPSRRDSHLAYHERIKSAQVQTEEDE